VRVLFVVSDRPLSSTSFGGSGVVYAGLLAMLRERGDRVHILLLKEADRPSRYEQWRSYDPAGAADLGSWTQSIELAEFRLPQRPGFVSRKLLGLRDPQLRAYPFLGSGICQRVNQAAERVEPDLVIAPDLTAGLACSRAALGAPVAYYHQDFFWKIRELREGGPDGSWRSGWGRRVLRRAEDQLVQSVDACITGSLIEVEALRAAGARTIAMMPPVVTGRPLPVPDSPPQPCRIVHLGGFGTTATRLGLDRFLKVVWPLVRKNAPDIELWVIGDTTAADADIMKQLGDSGAVVTGFVPDLTSVLRPGDLHVIPWERATGVRTRLVSCFQNGQALVAVRAGVAGYEGLEHGNHCFLDDRLEELAAPLVDLALDPEARVRLARGGQRYMTDKLTVGAVLPRFDALVNELTRGRHARAGVA
jgi:glycosyltransferase involved in cell wall biosynthesis